MSLCGRGLCDRAMGLENEDTRGVQNEDTRGLRAHPTARGDIGTS